MQTGTANGPRNRAFMGSNPIRGTNASVAYSNWHRY